MRNILLLIYRYHFFLLFLVLEALCIVFLVQNNEYQRAGFVNSSNGMVGKIYNTVGGFNNYLNLTVKVDELMEENARLRRMVADTSLISHTERIHVKDTNSRQQYNYITAHVINNSVNRRSNYLTLNKGKLEGVKPEDGVITSNGVVGKVKYVSDHFCVVSSLLHKDLKVSAMVKKNKYFGSITWEGGSPTHAAFNDIAVHVPIAKGDTIVTSSLSRIWPEGIMIGTIEAFDSKSGQNFYNITVKLSTTFENLSYVYIIDSPIKKELDTLEALIPKHD